MKKITLVTPVVLGFLFVFCFCGCGEKEVVYVGWESLIAEQTDYHDGQYFHRFYRGNDEGDIGYAMSEDGVNFKKFPGNPVLKNRLFPIFVLDEVGNRYLIAQSCKDAPHSRKYYLYDVNNPTAPIILNGGNPILTTMPNAAGWGFEMFNVGVAVVNGRWHMLIEGKSAGGSVFNIGYSYADWPLLNFNSHLSKNPVIGDAGNPSLAYIKERNAILALHGGDFARTGTWAIKASTASLTSDLSLPENWVRSSFNISKPGIHMADPDLGCGIESFPLVISAGFDQRAINTYYYSGTLLQFYDSVLANRSVELTEDANDPTMTIHSGWPEK